MTARSAAMNAPAAPQVPPRVFSPALLCSLEVLHVVATSGTILAFMLHKVLPRLCPALMEPAAAGVHVGPVAPGMCTAHEGLRQLPGWAHGTLCGPSVMEGPLQHLPGRLLTAMAAVGASPVLLWWSTGDGLPLIALPALAAMGAFLLGCALCGRGLRYGHLYLACCALRLLHVLCLVPGMVAGRGSRYHVIGLAIEQMNAVLPLWVGWCNAALLPVPIHAQLPLSQVEYLLSNMAVSRYNILGGRPAPGGWEVLCHWVLCTVPPPIITRWARLGMQPWDAVRSHSRQPQAPGATCRHTPHSAGTAGRGSGSKGSQIVGRPEATASAAAAAATAGDSSGRRNVPAGQHMLGAEHAVASTKEVLCQAASTACSPCDDTAAVADVGREQPLVDAHVDAPAAAADVPGARNRAAPVATTAAVAAETAAVPASPGGVLAPDTSTAPPNAGLKTPLPPGAFVLPGEYLYKPYSTRTVLAIKVRDSSSAPSASFDQLAGAVRAAAARAIGAATPDARAAHLVTVPGCVLLLGQLIVPLQPALGHSSSSSGRHGSTDDSLHTADSCEDEWSAAQHLPADRPCEWVSFLVPPAVGCGSRQEDSSSSSSRMGFTQLEYDTLEQLQEDAAAQGGGRLGGAVTAAANQLTSTVAVDNHHTLLESVPRSGTTTVASVLCGTLRGQLVHGASPYPPYAWQQLLHGMRPQDVQTAHSSSSSRATPQEPPTTCRVVMSQGGRVLLDTLLGEPLAAPTLSATAAGAGNRWAQDSSSCEPACDAATPCQQQQKEEEEEEEQWWPRHACRLPPTTAATPSSQSRGCGPTTTACAAALGGAVTIHFLVAGNSGTNTSSSSSSSAATPAQGCPGDQEERVWPQPLHHHNTLVGQVSTLLLPEGPAAELAGWAGACASQGACDSLLMGDLDLVLDAAHQLAWAGPHTGAHLLPDTATLQQLGEMALATADRLHAYLGQLGLTATAGLVAEAREVLLVCLRVLSAEGA